jgi:hypothetical protein
MEIQIEIKKRNRDFGIITWPLSLDFEVKTLFEQKNRIDLLYNDKTLKNRKVSYKYRKFSIGKKRLESMSDKKYFILSKKGSAIRISGK